MQIPAGVMANKYPVPRHRCQYIDARTSAMSATSTCSSSIGRMDRGVRTLVGLSQACCMPHYHTLLGKDTTQRLRLRISAIMHLR